MAEPSASELHISLSQLQLAQSRSKISTPPPAKSKTKTSKQPADSWEDDISASDTETEDALPTVLNSTADSTSPAPPPPTPSSPHSSAHSPVQPKTKPPPFLLADESTPTTQRAPRSDPSSSERRPEKSTAVASRLIAAGIGQKAPKRTKEQREYDNAVKLMEKKKRDEAREEEKRKELEREKALKDVWGD